MGCCSSASHSSDLPYATQVNISPYHLKRLGNQLLRTAIVIDIQTDEFELVFLNEYREDSLRVSKSKYISAGMLYRGMKVNVYSSAFNDKIDRVESTSIIISYGQVERDNIDIVKIRCFGKLYSDYIEIPKRAVFIQNLAIQSYVQIIQQDNLIIDIKKLTDEDYNLHFKGAPEEQTAKDKDCQNLDSISTKPEEQIVQDKDCQKLDSDIIHDIDTSAAVSEVNKDLDKLFEEVDSVEETDEISIVYTTEEPVSNLFPLPLEVSFSPTDISSQSITKASNTSYDVSTPEFQSEVQRLNVSFGPSEFIKYENSS